MATPKFSYPLTHLNSVRGFVPRKTIFLQFIQKVEIQIKNHCNFYIYICRDFTVDLTLILRMNDRIQVFSEKVCLQLLHMENATHPPNVALMLSTFMQPLFDTVMIYIIETVSDAAYIGVTPSHQVP